MSSYGIDSNGDLAEQYAGTPDLTSVYSRLSAVENELNKGSVSVTADGVKTWSQMFDSLWALIDFTKLSPNSLLTTGLSPNYACYQVSILSVSEVEFSNTRATTQLSQVLSIQIKESGSTFYTVNSMVGGATTLADNSPVVVGNGNVFTLYY